MKLIQIIKQIQIMKLIQIIKQIIIIIIINKINI